MKLTLEEHRMGDDPSFYTVMEFWDCECDDDYIHPVTPNQTGRCDRCETNEDEMPNSRANELRAELDIKRTLVQVSIDEFPEGHDSIGLTMLQSEVAMLTEMISQIDEEIGFPDAYSAIPYTSHHAAISKRFAHKSEDERREVVKALADFCYKMTEIYDGEMSSNQISWCRQDCENAEVGFLKLGNDVCDSSYAEELREKGFTQTFEQAVEALEARIKNTTEYII